MIMRDENQYSENIKIIHMLILYYKLNGVENAMPCKYSNISYNPFIYKDKSQMGSDNWNNYRGYASKVYNRKMSKSSINKMFNMAEGNQVKKSWRQYLIQGIYQTPSYRPQVGDVINLDPMEALNEDYENFELEFFMPRWKKVVDEGGLRMWGLAKVLSSSDNAYKNLTHFVFKNPTGE